MSKIALTPNVSGSGVFTIASPNSNTDRTLTLPDEAGTVLTSASDVAASALTGDIAAARITTALNATGSAPIYAARAWVNFNGTGTVAIRASGNVSSITDNGTGNYRVNFTTAMPDANYVMLGCTEYASSTDLWVQSSERNTGNVTATVAKAGALLDSAYVGVSIFR